MDELEEVCNHSPGLRLVHGMVCTRPKNHDGSKPLNRT
jgi:hypothetical protein